MKTVTIVNPTTSPVVFSDDGRVLGAGERREGVELDDTGRAARDRGDLDVVEEESADPDKTEGPARLPKK